MYLYTQFNVFWYTWLSRVLSCYDNVIKKLMKKGVYMYIRIRNGTGWKSNETRYRNVTWCSHRELHAQCFLPYNNKHYQGECGLIEGHAYTYSVLLLPVHACHFKHSHICIAALLYCWVWSWIWDLSSQTQQRQYII